MNPDQRAILFALAAVACWSTVATAFKVALAHVDTYQLLFFATLTATIILTTIVIYRQGVVAIRQAFLAHWKLAIIAGMLNPVIYYDVLFRAYDLLPAQIAMSINYTWAIVLTLMAMVFLRQKILAFDLLAAVICYAGVVIIVTAGDFSSVSEVNILGVVLALASTVIWAAYWIINIRDTRDPTLGLCLNFLIALPVTAINCSVFSSFAISVEGLLATSYVGAVEMAIGFIFWSTALKLTSNASRVSNLIFLSPFLSLIFIHLILGEEIFITTLMGLAMIISGLGLQQYGHYRVANAVA